MNADDAFRVGFLDPSAPVWQEQSTLLYTAVPCGYTASFSMGKRLDAVPGRSGSVTGPAGHGHGGPVLQQERVVSD